MSWLKKIAIAQDPVASQDPLIAIVDGILLNKGIDIISAGQQLQQAEAQGVDMTAVCQRINESAAGVNPAQPDSSAYKKMMDLAGAINSCEWNPVSPPMSQQPDNNMMDPAMMPQMGGQEQPMEMPSAEIGN